MISIYTHFPYLFAFIYSLNSASLLHLLNMLLSLSLLAGIILDITIIRESIIISFLSRPIRITIITSIFIIFSSTASSCSLSLCLLLLGSDWVICLINMLSNLNDLWEGNVDSLIIHLIGSEYSA